MPTGQVVMPCRVCGIATVTFYTKKKPTSTRCHECRKEAIGMPEVKKKPAPSRTKKIVAKVTGTPEPIPMPDDWKLAVELIKKGAPRVLLYGPPGTGKTYTAQHQSKANGGLAEVFVLPCTEDTPSSDVFGTDTIRDGSVVWRDGIGMLAWRLKNSRLVLDELDKASPEMLTSLLKVCDEQDSAGFHLPTGVFVRPESGLQVVACMNGEPEDLPEALADRFTVRVRITNPHPDAIMALSHDLWAPARDTTHGKVPEARRYTIRQFRAFDELRKLGLSEKDAAEGAFQERGKELIATLRLARETPAERAAKSKAYSSVLASFGDLGHVAKAHELVAERTGVISAAESITQDGAVFTSTGIALPVVSSGGYVRVGEPWSVGARVPWGRNGGWRRGEVK